jgi:hypothetical protein
MIWTTNTLPCAASSGGKCTCTTQQLHREKVLSDILSERKIKSPYHRKDHNMRAAHVEFKCTKDELEKTALALSSSVYLQNLTYPISKKPIRDYQFEILENFKNKRFNIVVPSRQSGDSYVLAIHALWSALKSDQPILIISRMMEESEHILDLIRELYCELPFFIKPGIKEWNSKKVTFDNGSMIVASTLKGFSGMTWNLVIIKDFAKMHPSIAKFFYNNILPIMTSRSDSSIIISSAPNGNNHFKKLIDTSPLFHTKFISWRSVSTRDENWMKQEIRNIGSIEEFAQEYENLFAGTKQYRRYVNLSKLGL